MWVMRNVSSLSFEFRGAFLAEGLLTFNIVVAEIAGLNRSVTGSDHVEMQTRKVDHTYLDDKITEDNISSR